MKKAIQKVLKDKKGFTLAELLIVVAIIAILVAVSVPIFTGQLEKSKKSTDDANARSAKAAAINDYYTQADTDGATYYYDADKGTVTTNETTAKAITGYGKSNVDKIIKVEISADGNATIKWVSPTTLN